MKMKIIFYQLKLCVYTLRRCGLPSIQFMELISHLIICSIAFVFLSPVFFSPSTGFHFYLLPTALNDFISITQRHKMPLVNLIAWNYACNQFGRFVIALTHPIRLIIKINEKKHSKPLPSSHVREFFKRKANKNSWAFGWENENVLLQVNVRFECAFPSNRIAVDVCGGAKGEKEAGTIMQWNCNEKIKK